MNVVDDVNRVEYQCVLAPHPVKAAIWMRKKPTDASNTVAWGTPTYLPVPPGEMIFTIPIPFGIIIITTKGPDLNFVWFCFNHQIISGLLCPTYMIQIYML